MANVLNNDDKEFEAFAKEWIKQNKYFQVGNLKIAAVIPNNI